MWFTKFKETLKSSCLLLSNKDKLISADIKKRS